MAHGGPFVRRIPNSKEAFERERQLSAERGLYETESQFGVVGIIPPNRRREDTPPIEFLTVDTQLARALGETQTMRDYYTSFGADLVIVHGTKMAVISAGDMQGSAEFNDVVRRKLLEMGMPRTTMSKVGERLNIVLPSRFRMATDHMELPQSIDGYLNIHPRLEDGTKATLPVHIVDKTGHCYFKVEAAGPVRIYAPQPDAEADAAYRAA